MISPARHCRVDLLPELRRFFGKKFVCIHFNHGGIIASPGRIKMYQRILLSIWQYFGNIIEVFYPVDLKHCVLCFKYCDELKLVSRLNDRQFLNTALDAVLTVVNDKLNFELTKRIISELFVERSHGISICATRISSWQQQHMSRASPTILPEVFWTEKSKL